MPKELRDLTNVYRVLKASDKSKKFNSLLLKIIKLLYLTRDGHAREFRDQITIV